MNKTSIPDLQQAFMGVSPSPSVVPQSWRHPVLIYLFVGVCFILLCYALHYYKILKRRYRSHFRTRPLNDAIPDVPALQFRSTGLDSSTISMIPIIQYKTNNRKEMECTNTECVICLAEFEEGEKLRNLPVCSHAFHVFCIDNWFMNNFNCPLCRSQVLDHPSAEESHFISA